MMGNNIESVEYYLIYCNALHQISHLHGYLNFILFIDLTKSI